MPTITGAHHAALTVTDADASAAWYMDLLGMVQVPGCGWIMGVRSYRDGSNDRFDELRTGLDHLAFGVSSLDELHAWEAELSSRDIPFTPAAETPIGTVVVFRDPDNIQLEMWLPLS